MENQFLIKTCSLKKVISILGFALILTSALQCQESEKSSRAHEIGFSYGIGYYTVKDQYISNNSYNGNAGIFKISWANSHQKYKYFLDFTYTSCNAKNGNVSADVNEIDFMQGFLYQLNLKNSKLAMYLGPMTDFYLHYRTQQVAGNILSRSYSGALLLSAAIMYRVDYRVAKRIQLRNDLSINIISLAARLPDFTLDESTFTKVQTVFSTTSLNNTLWLNYSICKSIDLRLGYYFHLLSFSDAFSGGAWLEDGWSKVNSFSNNILFAVNFRF